MSRRDTQLLNKAKNHYMEICERDQKEVNTKDQESYAQKQVLESKVYSLTLHGAVTTLTSKVFQTRWMWAPGSSSLRFRQGLRRFILSNTKATDQGMLRNVRHWAGWSGQAARDWRTYRHLRSSACYSNNDRTRSWTGLRIAGPLSAWSTQMKRRMFLRVWRICSNAIKRYIRAKHRSWKKDSKGYEDQSSLTVNHT